MLAAANRLGDAASFREVTRRGRRAASRTLVVHLLADNGREEGAATTSGSSDEPLFGLVVSRAVGNSVARNRVKRRLRHLLRARVGRVPSDARVVVRALPAAADSSSALLERDLDRCLERMSVDHAGHSA